MKTAALPDIIRPGQSIELLKALHILTRDGKLSQDSRRKLKQVYHLYHFIEPLLTEIAADGREPVLVDHGAGKSYLGFILYDLFFKSRDSGHIYGIETRGELVDKTRELARVLNFQRMTFLDIAADQAGNTPELATRIDIVTALHACNTATDDAIRFALQKKVPFVVLVPCCQAEVAAALNRNKNKSFGLTALSELWRHPIHTREFGSLITNTLRCLLLESQGYTVTVTELVGWEHSMKNELIIARRQNTPRKNARARAEAILHELNLEELHDRFIY